MSIGKNIKKFRLERGLTQRGLANKVGLAEITIRQYENESRTPTLKTLNIIADKLNILLSELISDDSLDSFTPCLLYTSSVHYNQLILHRVCA